ncbi:glycosyltransferase [Nocardia blacklockiae]|uniref:glycosyltransferase n=1 Tax=Nocardia blacklockiae TaxID=480036 RepID=UPI0018955B41|nr:glycosyltransferase [Nocardia blacklockiae]MBF6170093.1 glycosyltransferase [Nocardia blacklockiae]
MTARPRTEFDVQRDITHVPVSPTRGRDWSPDVVAAATELSRRVGRSRIWHVSSTALGGGVAELLWASIGHQKSLGLPTEWLVTDAEAEFFQLTKRIHHGLHGNCAGPFSATDAELYRRVTASVAVALAAVPIAPGDLVVLHDPQTVGVAPRLLELGARVVWRCHIGTKEDGAVTARTWEFLRPFVSALPLVVFTSLDYAPSYEPAAKTWAIAPSIDPGAEKNRDLTAEQCRDLLGGIGLLGPARHRLGAAGGIGRVVQDAALPPGAELITQVSRWDPLKDMTGVLRVFAERIAPRSSAHLLLLGPDPADIPDDPEGAGVFEQVCAMRKELAPGIRARTHLAVLSLRDRLANALTVNAAQRCSTVILQKSFAEGFGLTVTEAMWKARPIVASAVGGPATQLTDRIDGLLVDPHDDEALAESVLELLNRPGLAAELGAAARRTCEERFLVERELSDYMRLYNALLHT